MRWQSVVERQRRVEADSWLDDHVTGARGTVALGPEGTVLTKKRIFTDGTLQNLHSSFPLIGNFLKKEDAVRVFGRKKSNGNKKYGWIRVELSNFST